MGKIDRLKRITMARIEAFLETLEQPEYILPRLIKEMAQQVTEAGNATAKALSAVKGAHRRLDEANGKVLRLSNGAKLAIQVDDMNTARQAVAAQIAAEKKMNQCQAELEQAEKAYQSASAVCSQLAANLKELKKKKTQLLKQYRQHQLTKQLQKKYTQSVIKPETDIFDVIARMETKIDQQEIELETQTELTKTLGIGFNEEHISKLIEDAEIDQRLNEIRQKLQQ